MDLFINSGIMSSKIFITFNQIKPDIITFIDSGIFGNKYLTALNAEIHIIENIQIIIVALDSLKNNADIFKNLYFVIE